MLFKGLDSKGSQMATDGLLPELDEGIAFQTKWSDIMSVSYMSMSALAVIASGAATVVAALGFSWQGAVLAAVATISFGVEKALMLREKWAHNLATAARLKSIRLALVYGGLDTKTAALQMGQILEGYANRLPMMPRAETPEDHQGVSAAN